MAYPTSDPNAVAPPTWLTTILTPLIRVAAAGIGGLLVQIGAVQPTAQAQAIPIIMGILVWLVTAGWSLYAHQQHLANANARVAQALTK